MRIAFLFNYPLADNAAWKQELIRRLRPRHELMVVFGKTRLVDYARAYLRRRQEQALSPPSAPDHAPSPRRRTMSVLRELGVPVRRVRNVNDPECVDALLEWKPDYVVTALDHLFDKRAIARLPVILNCHYGVLPEVKGWNATEWSLFVTGRLSVSLHRVVWPVDSGDIYLTGAIECLPTDDLGSLYAKCQSRALDLYTQFFEDPARCLQAATPGRAGKTYYVMNRRMKQEVLDRLRAGRFARSTTAAASPAEG